MSIIRSVLLSGCAIAACMAAAPAHAQASEDIGVEILELLVEEGVLSSERAQGLLDRARATAQLRRQAEAPKTASTIDVPYVPEVVKEQLRTEIKQQLVDEARTEGWIGENTLPSWLERISFSGDLRVRYQGDFFGEDNFPFFPDAQAINEAGGVTTADGFPLLNTTVNRNRLRYRARLGVSAQIAPEVLAVLRLGSGNDDGPNSTNENLGDYFDKDALWIDQAYLRLTPFKQLSITGGRMPNPFFSTDMVWDPDINPEGVAATASYSFGSQKGAPTVFATGGAFPLEEYDAFTRDKWLFAGQIGVETTSADDFSAKVAVAYYDYVRVQSLKNPIDGSRLNDFTVPRRLSNGNSTFNMRTDGTTTLAGLASDFDLINATAQIGYAGFGNDIRVSLTGDYVQNLALDAAEINALREEPGVPPGDTGYQVRLDVGKDAFRKPGDWRVGAAYKRIETDAVLDIFTDSDFGLGGTDLEGYLVEAGVGVFANTALSLRWLSANSISRPPLSIDVLQVSFDADF